MSKSITDTGLRGYLKWLKQQQPAIYRDIAPRVAQLVPEGFSDREQSNAMGSLMGLADDSGASDVSDAANSGAASSSVTGTIANLVTLAGQAYLTKEQIDLLGKINDVQLSRVNAGLNPLDINMANFGVPQVNVGLSPQTLSTGSTLFLVGAAVALLFLFKPKHGGAAALA